MKKSILFIGLIFSLLVSSCGFITFVPMETGTNQPSDTSSDKPSSPAPTQSLPPPSNDGASTRSTDSGGEDRSAFYKELKLSDAQITKFEAITKKYEGLTNDAKLKYKAQQSTLKQELKKLETQQQTEIKAMMSDYQYQNYLKVMQEKRGGSGVGKAKVGG